MKDQLKISIVQTSLYWEHRESNWEQISKKILGVKDADIIVLPETFTTGFSMNSSIAESDGKTLEWMQKIASTKGCAIAGSYFVKEKGNCYNRLHFVEPNGHVTFYDKKHLFRLTNEQEMFSSGDKQMVVHYQGWKISLMVCYDLRFPVWMRRSSSNDFDAILIVANWPERRAYAWNHLLIARAIENQSYVIGCNRVGKDGTDVLYGGESVILDPMGHSLIKGPPFEEEILSYTIEKSKLESIRKALPFYEDRDSFRLE